MRNATRSVDELLTAGLQIRHGCCLASIGDYANLRHMT
jgi:hypothetical protein